MIPATFEYHAPAGAEEVVALLAAGRGETRIMGGGTWVVPELGRGESRPRVLVDLSRAGLRGVQQRSDGLWLGAMSTYSDLLASHEIRRHCPLLAQVAAGITGGETIRRQGTVGGSAAAARPQSDMPAALVAAQARAVLRGTRGERRMEVHELVRGAMRTALGEDELLCGFELPFFPAPTVTGYVKIKRGASSWPIATASAVITRRGATCLDARVVLGAVAATPVVVDVSPTLSGGAASPAAIAEAAEVAAAAVTEPWSDALAPGDYRRSVAGPVARRALQQALAADGPA